jgi:hypothetical protein
MCALAHQNSRVVDHWNACWDQGDGPTWLYGTQEVIERDCAERVASMAAGPYDMQFNERYMDRNGTLCDKMVYGVTLRDPLDRAVSHVNEMMKDFFAFDCSCGDGLCNTPQLNVHNEPVAAHPRIACTDVQREHLFERLLAPEAHCTADHVLDVVFEPGGYDRWTTTKASIPSGKLVAVTDQWEQLCGITSNYQARALLGRAADAEPFIPRVIETSPEGQAALVAPALKVLLGISLVLTVEDNFGEDDNSIANLANLTFSSFAWRNVTRMEHARDSSEYRSKTLLDPAALADTEWAALRKSNMADVALHAHARAIEQLDSRFVRDAGIGYGGFSSSSP